MKKETMKKRLNGGKTMKKIIALLTTLALAISAVALPALAEDAGGTVDQVTSATQNSRNSHPGKDGRGGNRQKPGQNSTAPQAPDAGITPQAPEQDSQDGQATVKNGKNGKNASAKKGKAARNDTQLVFDRLLAENVITREVYDAITAWLNSQSGAAAPAESAAPAENSETVSAEAQLLKSLLDSGVLSQEQYDLLLSGLRSAPVAN